MNQPAEIQVHHTAAVARIVVSNPSRRNALTVAMKQQLVDAFDQLERNTDARCIVLSGAGSETFVSGADISEFEQVRGNPESEAAYMRLGAASLLSPARSSKPVIAAIRGACVGGGLQLAAGCDIRIAARGATFLMPAARLGIAYPYAGLALFVSLLGPARTAELFMTARKIGADEALAIGLVSQVVADDELDATVDRVASGIAANAPLTLALIKESIRARVDATELETPAAVQRWLDACGNSTDMVEGRNAFLEKRKARFQGK